MGAGEGEERKVNKISNEIIKKSLGGKHGGGELSPWSLSRVPSVSFELMCKAYDICGYKYLNMIQKQMNHFLDLEKDTISNFSFMVETQNDVALLERLCQNLVPELAKRVLIKQIFPCDCNGNRMGCSRNLTRYNVAYIHSVILSKISVTMKQQL